MFIQTESTPNPNSIKFLPGCKVAGDLPPADFETLEATETRSGLAVSLFQINGVARVYLGADFVTVTKTHAQSWEGLKTLVMAAIMDHFAAELPVFLDGVDSSHNEAPEKHYEGETAEIVEQIKELIELRIRPAVAQDGGDIVFEDFESDTGIVYLSMRGACAGCPSSTMTLKQGVENLLRHYVPEVAAVEAVL